MSLYTPEVREFVHTRDWPRGLQLDIIEEVVNIEGLLTPSLRFQFYRDNWMKFEAADHIKIANTVKEVMEALRAQRIPCYMGKMESRNAA